MHRDPKRSPEPGPSAFGTAGTPEPIEPLPFPIEPRAEPARPRLSVVIPVFNEEAVLDRTSRELATALEQLEVDWKVLFVNDGSRTRPRASWRRSTRATRGSST